MLFYSLDQKSRTLSYIQCLVIVNCRKGYPFVPIQLILSSSLVLQPVSTITHRQTSIHRRNNSSVKKYNPKAHFLDFPANGEIDKTRVSACRGTLPLGLTIERILTSSIDDTPANCQVGCTDRFVRNRVLGNAGLRKVSMLAEPVGRSVGRRVGK